MNAPARIDFLAARKSGVGGTDISAIVGLNKWKTATQVFLDKTNQSDPIPDNDRMYWGRALEDLVAKEYQVRTGQKTQKVNQQLAHPDHEWAIGNIDRAIVVPEISGIVRWKDGRLTTTDILEVKTASSYAEKQWGEPGTDSVPDIYVLQVQWYMAITSTKVAKIAVLIGGSDFRIYTVERDDSLISDLLEAGHAFWHNHVLKGIAPEPSTYDEAASKWSRHVGQKSKIVDVSIAQACEEIKTLKAQIKDIESQIDERQLLVAKAFEDAETITCAGDVLATWKVQESTRLDSKALKAAHPEIASQFSNTTTSRVLRIK